MNIRLNSKTFSKLLVSKVILLGLASGASAQSSQFTAYWVCGDSPPVGVPQLRGTCALDLNGTEILAANRLTATVTIHQFANPTMLDGIIPVPTVAPEYYNGPGVAEFYNGPRGVVFYHGDRNGRDKNIIICTYSGLICTWNPNTPAKTRAKIQINHFALGARYVALDIGGGNRSKPDVYVANESAQQIEHYNHSWKPVGRFRDTGLTPDYEPVSLCVSGDLLYTGWRFTGQPGQDLSQAPVSYISVFNLRGQFLRRFPVGHALGYRLPVGMVITPPRFGNRSNALAMCDSHFVTFWDPNTGASLGHLSALITDPPSYPPMWLDGITNLKSDGDSRLYITISAQSEYDGAIVYVQAEP
jgi:hypothetical protein